MRRSRRPSYFSDDTSRGLDILRLQLGVQARALKVGALVVLLAASLAAGGWFFAHVSLVETADTLAWLSAWVALVWIGTDTDWIPVWTDRGWIRFLASTVLTTDYIIDSLIAARRHGTIAGLIGLGVAVPTALAVIHISTRRGRKVYSDTVARGTPVASARTLRRAVRRAGASRLAICDVPLPEQALNRHILLLGSTRSGKSLSIRRLLRTIEARGDVAIVFDKVGDYVSEFYRQDRHDLLMNPLDRRSAPWSPWCEGDTPVDHARIARSLIPRRPNDRNVFFQEGARTLLVALLDRVGRMDGRTITTLLDVAYRWDRDAKAAFLAGTDAAKHFAGTSDAGHDVDATMGVFAQGLRFLPRASGTGDDRAIRTFLRDVIRIREEGADALLAELEEIDPATGEVRDGRSDTLKDPAARARRAAILRLARPIEAGRTPWMFLAAETESMDALMPLIGLWIDLAVTTVLGLAPREERRIWFVLDEWHTLGKLSRLQDLLTEGAKYGACVIAGTQNIGQIRENYGPDAAEAMLSLFNTKAVFRLPEPVSADWASRYMGDLVWDQARESVRYGTSETMDGASISDGRVMERKVMAHEIIDLPDLTAYLSIAGDFPTARVATRFDRRRDPAIRNTAPFLPRPFEDLAWEIEDTARIPRPDRPGGTARPHPPSQPLRDRPDHPAPARDLSDRDGDDPGDASAHKAPAPSENTDAPDMGTGPDTVDASGEPPASDPQPDLFASGEIDDQIATLHRQGVSQRLISERLGITRHRVRAFLDSKREDE